MFSLCQSRCSFFSLLHRHRKYMSVLSLLLLSLSLSFRTCQRQRVRVLCASDGTEHSQVYVRYVYIHPRAYLMLENISGSCYSVVIVKNYQLFSTKFVSVTYMKKARVEMSLTVIYFFLFRLCTAIQQIILTIAPTLK